MQELVEEYLSDSVLSIPVMYLLFLIFKLVTYLPSFTWYLMMTLLQFLLLQSHHQKIPAFWKDLSLTPLEEISSSVRTHIPLDPESSIDIEDIW